MALYALMARPVITGDSTQQIIVRQLTETIPPSRTLRADLPAALAEAVDRETAFTAKDAKEGQETSSDPCDPSSPWRRLVLFPAS